MSKSLDDNETKLILSEICEKKKQLIDPHTAIGIGAIKKNNLAEKLVSSNRSDATNKKDLVNIQNISVSSFAKFSVTVFNILIFN